MKRIAISALAVLSVALATPAAAKPIYLTCEQFDFTLDEANSQAVMKNTINGNVFRFPASFGPSEVSFANRDVAFSINRVTLDFAYTIKMLRETTRGTCKLAEPPSRAF